MMNIIYRKANKNDIPKLKSLWIDTFDEAETAVNIFFDNTMSYTSVYCAESEEEIVSAVYLIHCKLNDKKAHYLCGASTNKAYRKMGIMSKLIKYALDNSGDEYSVLFPANESLYGFYSKLGYSPECTAKRCVISKQELLNMELNPNINKNNILIQNNKFLDFAESYYSYYGIKVLKNEKEIIFADEKENCTEIFFLDYADSNALKSLIKKLNSEKFILTLKSDDKNFDGEIIKYGMIKSINSEDIPQNVYIGITLN